ncbi:MAG: leucine-rich repeat domain-containing protein [Terriglobales bacterium]
MILAKKNGPAGAVFALAIAAIVLIVAASARAMPRSGAPEAAAPQRVIEFPASSVGQIAPAVQGQWDYFERVGAEMPARGQVQFPADARSILYVNRYGAQHLEFLQKLKSNDLNAVRIEFGTFGEEGLNDAGISHIAHLSALEELWMPSADATDQTMTAVIAKLPDLRSLSLEGTMITSANTKVLSKLNKLNFLSLSFTRINDATMKDIENLTDLRSLQLRHTFITTDGVKLLRKLVLLRDLNLSGNKIRNAALIALPFLPKLHVLSLSDTYVSDLGVACVAKFPNLQILDLMNCDISKTGLRSLTQLRKLKFLNIAGSTFTGQDLKVLQRLPCLNELKLSLPDDRLAALRKDLPRCKITVDNHHSNLNRDQLPLELFRPLH